MLTCVEPLLTCVESLGRVRGHVFKPLVTCVESFWSETLNPNTRKQKSHIQDKAVADKVSGDKGSRGEKEDGPYERL